MTGGTRNILRYTKIIYYIDNNNKINYLKTPKSFKIRHFPAMTTPKKRANSVNKRSFLRTKTEKEAH